MHKINNRLSTLLPEKVAGTSFYKQNIDTFGLNPYQAIPEKTFEAFVTPEPDNAYDPNAKRVDIMVPTGVKGENMIYKIGYRMYIRFLFWILSNLHRIIFAYLFLNLKSYFAILLFLYLFYWFLRLFLCLYAENI